jgi:putative endonuclease
VHYVYVLRSFKNGKRYVGSTGQDVSARLRQHNRGQNRWAAQNRPFELVRVEEYTSKAEAVRRERFLKTGVGRRELELLLQ